MALFRWIIGLPMAALVTGALFFMMAELIKDRGEPLPPEKPQLDLVITAKQTDTPVDERRPTPPPIPDTMPEPDYDFKRREGLPDGITVGPGPIKVDPTPPDPGTIQGPTIRIAPNYPEGCRSRSATGVVLVQFDVTPEGDVVNPQIIETPDRCFNRTVIKAVSGWKYPPANANGRAVMRYGVVETFNFQLVD